MWAAFLVLVMKDRVKSYRGRMNCLSKVNNFIRTVDICCKSVEKLEESVDKLVKTVDKSFDAIFDSQKNPSDLFLDTPKTN